MEAARTVYWSGGILKPEDEVATPWELWEIKQLSRSGNRNTVVAAPVSEDDKNPICFAFDSARDVIEVNDLIFLQADVISIFDMRKMKTRRYKIAMIDDGNHDDPEEK